MANNRLRLSQKQQQQQQQQYQPLSTLAMIIITILFLMNEIQQNQAGPMAQMRAFRLGQSLTRPPMTVWLRVFYPFPIDVVEKKYVPVKIPTPVYVNGMPPSSSLKSTIPSSASRNYLPLSSINYPQLSSYPSSYARNPNYYYYYKNSYSAKQNQQQQQQQQQQSYYYGNYLHESTTDLSPKYQIQSKLMAPKEYSNYY
ncbi:uncharacterized protein LOC124491259 [Dermatophagoides farinae]|uniref:uncharacterized protein LOC124491259 n=1 Tax=Dermatophagoides farinae TaxID=6954 RepID=UPI003F5F3E4C